MGDLEGREGWGGGQSCGPEPPHPAYTTSDFTQNSKGYHEKNVYLDESGAPCARKNVHPGRRVAPTNEPPHTKFSAYHARDNIDTDGARLPRGASRRSPCGVLRAHRSTPDGSTKGLLRGLLQGRGTCTPGRMVGPGRMAWTRRPQYDALPTPGD